MDIVGYYGWWTRTSRFWKQRRPSQLVCCQSTNQPVKFSHPNIHYHHTSNSTCLFLPNLWHHDGKTTLRHPTISAGRAANVWRCQSIWYPHPFSCGLEKPSYGEASYFREFLTNDSTKKSDDLHPRKLTWILKPKSWRTCNWVSLEELTGLVHGVHWSPLRSSIFWVEGVDSGMWGFVAGLKTLNVLKKTCCVSYISCQNNVFIWICILYYIRYFIKASIYHALKSINKKIQGGVFAHICLILFFSFQVWSESQDESLRGIVSGTPNQHPPSNSPGLQYRALGGMPWIFRLGKSFPWGNSLD